MEDSLDEELVGNVVKLFYLVLVLSVMDVTHIGLGIVHFGWQ